MGDAGDLGMMSGSGQAWRLGREDVHRGGNGVWWPLSMLGRELVHCALHLLASIEQQM